MWSVATPPAEFGLIARHFRPLASEAGLGLADDAAVFTPPPDRQIVVSADAMVAGVHFLPDDPTDTIGRKLLRVNLSDLAAMGAAPLGYLLTVSVPTGTPDSWFAAFAYGLSLDQEEYGIGLLGGDTTSTPGPISLSATVLGHVAPGAALRRYGARDGDGIWVTGTIGDGALGLRACRGEIADPTGWLASRYRLPQPRLGLDLHGIASAAMDISDGLIQDLGHICTASGTGATIYQHLVPLSPAARSAIGHAAPTGCVTGGDDYELLLTVPAAMEAALRQTCADAQTQITRIGEVTAGPAEVRLLDDKGGQIAIAKGGWSHF